MEPELAAYVLAVKLLLGLETAKVAILPGACGPRDTACISTSGTNSYELRIVRPPLPWVVMTEVVRHELCHVKLDNDHLDDFSELPKKERDYRHLRVEVCQKDLERRLKRKR